MCGGGGGIVGKVFGSISKVLFGSPKDRGLTFNAPDPQPPAPPAPSRKTDTGAKVVVGADQASDMGSDRGRKSKRRSISSLASRGARSGLGL